MAEGGSPVVFNVETPNMSAQSSTSEPQNLPLELIDGFYKFKAMEQMNLKTKQFANYWIDCQHRWDQYEALLNAGYSFEEVSQCLSNSLNSYVVVFK